MRHRLRLPGLFLLSALAAAAGCGASRGGPSPSTTHTPTPTPPPGAGSWSSLSVATTADLTAAAGGSASDVWFGGAGSTLLHGDGASFSPAAVFPAPPATPLAGLWSDAIGSVWLGAGVKYAYHGDGTSWTTTNLQDNRTAAAFWGSGPSDLWTIGELSGYLGHWDGSAWDHLNSAIAGMSLTGAGSSDVWALNGCSPANGCADSSTILHWAGASAINAGSNTITVDTVATSTHFLATIAAVSPTDVWAAGGAGLILHSQGGAFTPVTSPTSATIWALWAESPTQVWAVGDGGMLLFYDGANWTEIASPTTQTLRAIVGFPDGTAFAVGDHGAVVRHHP